VVRCQEIGWLRDSGQPESTGWSTYALGQLRGAAARWADAKYPAPERAPEWADFDRNLRAEFTPFNTVRELSMIVVLQEDYVDKANLSTDG
jgi:hypothetical protein